MYRTVRSIWIPCALLLGVVGGPSGPLQAAARQAAPVAHIADVAWIAGAWKGMLGPMQIEERWTPADGGAMLGVSRTIRGGKMVAFEFLRIEERPTGLVYIAQPNGRPPTEFALTRADGESAVFENPQHDHPKIIRYKKTDDTLVAEIEGDQRGKHVTQAFTFHAAK
jgi:Domain of unknown function (DUF6265)